MSDFKMFLIYAGTVLINAVLFISCVKDAMRQVDNITLYDDDNNPVASGTPVLSITDVMKNTFVFFVPIVNVLTIGLMSCDYTRSNYVEYLIDAIGFEIDCAELEEDDEA